jgi:predicted aspartyl protease
MHGSAGRARPFLDAHINVPSLGVEGDVAFLVDTGADLTVVAPMDALRLGISLSRLEPETVSIGIGGRTPIASVGAILTLDASAIPLALRVLAPRGRRQQQALMSIPSLLGRDVLARYALFLETRSERVLLLEPDEADALPL